MHAESVSFRGGLVSRLDPRLLVDFLTGCLLKIEGILVLQKDGNSCLLSAFFQTSRLTLLSILCQFHQPGHNNTQK